MLKVTFSMPQLNCGQRSNCMTKVTPASLSMRLQNQRQSHPTTCAGPEPHTPEPYLPTVGAWAKSDAASFCTKIQASHEQFWNLAKKTGIVKRLFSPPPKGDTVLTCHVLCPQDGILL